MKMKMIPETKTKTKTDYSTLPVRMVADKET